LNNKINALLVLVGILMGHWRDLLLYESYFVKLAYRDSQVDVLALLALRMLLFSFFYCFGDDLIGQKTNVKFTTRQWINIAVIGCLGYYVSSALDFLGLKFITAGIERLILFAYPTFVLIMNACLVQGKSDSASMECRGPDLYRTRHCFPVGRRGSRRVMIFYFGGSDDPAVCCHLCILYVGSGRMIPAVARRNSTATNVVCMHRCACSLFYRQQR